MKRVIAALIVLSVAWTAAALDKPELEQRARKLLLKFEQMQQKPDKSVPANVLSKAQGIILLDRTKAGFVFAYQGGTGLAIVKDKKGKWGPVAFMEANEGSVGFQIGGQQSFVVIVLMTAESTKLLTESTFEVGGEARGTAGDTSSGVDASVVSTTQPILVYDDRQGLFGGAALKGGAIAPDDEANLLYYGQPLTTKEILFDRKVKATETATTLARKLNEQASRK
jgi:SH3 domain-containing YSC84-like protein 1